MFFSSLNSTKIEYRDHESVQKDLIHLISDLKGGESQFFFQKNRLRIMNIIGSRFSRCQMLLRTLGRHPYYSKFYEIISFDSLVNVNAHQWLFCKLTATIFSLRLHTGWWNSRQCLNRDHDFINQ